MQIQNDDNMNDTDSGQPNSTSRSFNHATESLHIVTLQLWSDLALTRMCFRRVNDPPPVTESLPVADFFRLVVSICWESWYFCLFYSCL